MSKNEDLEASQPIPELRREQALELFATITNASTEVSTEENFSYETVNKHGDVKPLVIREAHPEDPDLKTVFSKVPLVNYEDDALQHEVALYTRRTSGYYHNTNSSEDISLFVVDQATDADGNKHLAANPGILLRATRVDRYGEGSDESQLTMAVLRGTNGTKDIEQLLAARQADDNEETARLEGKILDALHERSPERVTTDGFDEQSWGRKGVQTPFLIAENKAKYDARKAREAEQWARVSKIRKFGNAIIAKLDSDRYNDAQHAYFERKYERHDYS